SAVDIAPDGTVVLAGSFPGYAPSGVITRVLNDGTSGLVIRADRDGSALRSISRIGTRVNDMEIGADGRIIVCGDFGVAALDAEADTVLWSANPGEGRRCAVGTDGTVAFIANGNAYVYNAVGDALKTWAIGGTTQDDITVDGASGLVLAGGYTQKNVAGQCSGVLKVPYVRAWRYNGQLAWSAYDASAQQAQSASQCADSRVQRLAIGRDGKLYLAGTTDGGNTAFARDPQNIATQLGNRQVKFDKYNDPYNLGPGTYTWFGRYDGAQGQLLLGQFLLTRMDSNKGNSVGPRAISADADGTIYLAGEAYYKLANREAQRVGGLAVGEYEGGEAFVAVFTPDLKLRIRWTPLAGPAPSSAGGSPAVGIAVRDGRAAAALTFAPKSGITRSLITLNALQPAPSGANDGYLVVWK
ncbi:MAG: hypothetical protein H7Z42_06045, partial [Roseiflexaceae bacterium]|nr:hypothetical protein [Roseiflexaceae bacterium]